MNTLNKKLGRFLISSALVSTLIPFSPAVSYPVKAAEKNFPNISLKDSQKRLTNSSKSQVTMQLIPAIKQTGMLISQNLDTSLAGRWTGVLTPVANSCLAFGVSIPNQAPVNITVRISGDTVEIIEGSVVYKGELRNNGRDAKAEGRVSGGVLTWLLWDRIGNTATLAIAYQADLGCLSIYYGKVMFQGS